MVLSVKYWSGMHRHWSIVFMLLISVVKETRGDLRGACPTNPSLLGYTSILELNHDIVVETEAIENDPLVDPKSSYRYTLCPDTIFDVRERLAPLLNNSAFVCGENGDSSDNCIISGGDVQVLILEWPTDVELEYVSFQGITFADCTGVSIAAYAPNVSTAEFKDCHWKNGTGGSAVHIAHLPLREWTSPNPTITKDEEFVPKKEDNNIFLPNNRILKPRDQNLAVANTRNQDHRAVHLVEEQRPRASMRVNIYDSSISDGYISDGGQYIGFYNAGYLSLNNVLMENNVGLLFTNVVGGVLAVYNSRVVNNTFQAAIHAAGDASVIVRDTEFVENVGFGNVVSINSKVEISRCVFVDSVCVNGGDVLSLNSSVMTLNSCCFIGGKSLSPVFIDSTSAVETINNFGIRQDSVLCSDRGGILQGNTDMDCLLDRSIGCNGECRKFDASSCAFGAVGTPTYVAIEPKSASERRISFALHLLLGMGFTIMMIL